MAAILIVDDEKVLANSLGMLFTDEGHRVTIAYNGDGALRTLSQSAPDIVLLDLRLPDFGGMEVLREIRKSAPDALVIMMTAYGDTATVVEAVKLGAFNYVNKPFELQEILILVNQALAQQSLRDEVAFLRNRQLPSGELAEMVGNCPAMQEVFERIRLVAAAGDSSVLITGESGTGKELVARALHRLSDRQENSYVEVNCSAIPENLLESELFGFEKGAFTHAQSRKKGLFELAHGGTIFLDEIGEMPVVLQAKLLRFLETRSFRRLGGTADIAINARIVAATNRNLAEMVRAGHFREDLYYRLNVIPIQLPALRERGKDILLVARHFLERFCRELGRPPKQLTPETEDLFLIYAWPGNIRELKNIIERLVILCPVAELSPAYLPQEIRRQAGTERAKSGSLEEGQSIDDVLLRFEAEIIRGALERTDGRKMEAAETLGISRHSLKRRLQKLGMFQEDDEDV
jgi:two-component system response regulator AtoC